MSYQRGNLPKILRKDKPNPKKIFSHPRNYHFHTSRLMFMID